MKPSQKKITAKELKKLIEFHIKYTLCKQIGEAHKKHLFTALALAVRDLCVDQMMQTAKRHNEKNTKRIYYLSMEYLIGRSLENNLRCLGIYNLLDKIKLKNPIPLKSVFDMEYDPALGNGGLGRLAFCILDSLATLGYASYGYGINYQFGLFKQKFENGYQIEETDSWLDESSPWQIERTDRTVYIPIKGRVVLQNGHPIWTDVGHIKGIPFDMPVVGYGGQSINYLRLYSAHATNELDLKAFNTGSYIKAVEKKVQMETISKILYPSDSFEEGRHLRFVQQYFFTSCALKDIMRRFFEKNKNLKDLPKKVVIQLNDTHPTLAILELMRILMDEHHLNFVDAWDITTQTMAYTNHTLLPEALEKWDIKEFEEWLPRHLNILFQINDWLMNLVEKRFPHDLYKKQVLSIFEEGEHKKVRMANLAIAGSFSVNGVAGLHSELIKSQLVPDFYELWPQKFNNKTNGVTPRRWLIDSNPDLSALITKKIGKTWPTHLEELEKLNDFANDEGFLRSFVKIKHQNKQKLADYILKSTGILVNPDSIFDVQVKRIHEYKRQLLNIFHVIYEYLTVKEDHHTLIHPKTYIFAGKAAPEYQMAKLIIKLINSVAKTVNNDPTVNGQIKVVFIPNYNVSTAELIFPGADVSEQISTAGFEASGTGNMKFMMNGALTVGTLDGANIEIRQQVGEDNFYLFGLTADEVKKVQQNNKPWDLYHKDKRIKRVMDTLTNNVFNKDEPGIFDPLFQNIMTQDYFLVLSDFVSYIEIQEKISMDYLDWHTWGQKSLLNVAHSGYFSSDRTVTEYAKDIWHITPTTEK